MIRFIRLTALLFLSAFLSCGDMFTDMGSSNKAGATNKQALTNPNTLKVAGTAEQQRKTAAKIEASKQAAARGDPALLQSLGLSDGGSLGSNPKATLLRPYFSLFAKRPIDGKIDPFRSNLARFAPHVEIEEETAGPEETPKTPLEYFDVHSYQLVIIMSGTAQPKALMVDPKGKSFIVQTGTKIGNRNGKIVSITATEVRIEEPALPPVTKVLEPPIVEMEKELQAVQEF